MRYLAVLVIVVLAGVTSLMPPPVAPDHGDNPPTAIPPVSICPVVATAGRSTQISVLSSVNGRGHISTFAAGSVAGTLDFRTGSSGSVTLEASEVGAVGDSGGLIEMPSASTASGVLVTGASSRAAEACADIPSGVAFIAGGTTVGESLFELQLLNPYAGEAVVDLTVTTDAGIESDDRFDAVVIPALSTITLDMSDIIPGREEIAVDIEVTAGSALAVGRQTIGDRTALWRAVEPAQDWWIPIPRGGGTKQLLLASPSSTEVEYQIDYFGAEGLQEAFDSGVLPARGRQRIPLAAISESTAAMRVITTGPIVPTLWIDSAAGFAMTTASPVEAPVWLLPGASAPPGGAGSIVILNTGLEEVSVDVRSLEESSITRNFNVPSEGVVEVDLVTADGYRVESTGPIVALSTSQLDGAGTVAIGIPIQDG